MRRRLWLGQDLEVDGGMSAAEEQEVARMEEELTRYASSMFVRARPDLATRISARLGRQPGGPAPRRFFAALASFDPRAVVQAFRMTLVVAFGNIGVPDVMRAQALLVVLLVTTVAYTGALGTAGIVVGIAEATRPLAGRSAPSSGPSSDQTIIDGAVFSSASSGRLETLPTQERDGLPTRQASDPQRTRSNVSRVPQNASRPSDPKRWRTGDRFAPTRDDVPRDGRPPHGKGPNGKGPNGKGPNGKGPNGTGPNGTGPNDKAQNDNAQTGNAKTRRAQSDRLGNGVGEPVGPPSRGPAGGVLHDDDR